MRLWLTILVLAGLVGGCASHPPDNRLYGVLAAFDRGEYEQSLRLQEERMSGKIPEKDTALEKMRLGMAAFECGNYSLADSVLKDAIVEIGDFGRVVGEGKATSLFGKESSASYKGHPYERMLLLNYYGMCRYRMGDYETALAAFQNAIAEDYASEMKAEYQKTKKGREILQQDPDYFVCDSVFAHYMTAQCRLRLGEKQHAEESLSDARTEAQKTAYALGQLPPERYFNVADAQNANLLIVIATGVGPVKVGEGEYHELCKIVPGPPRPESAARVVLAPAGVALPTTPMEDVYFQASTRGGRKMDGILKGKAQFKRTADTVGTGLLIGGAAVAASRNGRHTTEAGLGIMGIGLIAKILSSATTPQADLRRCEMFPARLNVVAASVPPGSYTLLVQFTGPGGQPLPDQQQIWHRIVVPEKGQAFFYFRSGSGKANWAAPGDNTPFCFDSIGHKQGNKPYALGGTCFCTPTPDLIRKLHEDRIALDYNLESLTRLYQDRGIQLKDDGPHAHCDNHCESGPHVILGGRCMSPPEPGTREFEMILSAKQVPPPQSVAETTTNPDLIRRNGK